MGRRDSRSSSLTRAARRLRPRPGMPGSRSAPRKEDGSLSPRRRFPWATANSSRARSPARRSRLSSRNSPIRCAAPSAAWPGHKPLGVRVSCTDWVEGGWDIEQTVAFARELKKLGCDWIDCSSGGLVKNQVIPVAPGYQVPFAERIRKDAGIATIAIGMITEARQAENIVAEGKADMVSLARGFLWDPRWAWHAALDLGAEPRIPPQYLRARPAGRADVSGERAQTRSEE